MGVERTFRTGRTYHLHVKTTAAGNTNYFFSTSADGPLADADNRRFASVMAMLRFTLADKKTRAFVTERFFFRGSLDDWISIAGPGALAVHVSKFVKHLGRDSFCQLF